MQLSFTIIVKYFIIVLILSVLDECVEQCIYQTGVRGDRNACSGLIYAVTESELTGHPYGLAYSQVTVPFCVNNSDSSGHSIRSCYGLSCC